MFQLHHHSGVRTSLAFSAALLLAAGEARAQSSEPSAAAAAPVNDAIPSEQPSTPSEGEAQGKGWTFQLRTGAFHQFAANFSDTPGEVSFWQAGASADFGLALGESGRLNFAAGARTRGYNFDNATGFIAGDSRPWTSTVWQYDASIRYSHFHTDRLASFYLAGATALGENGSEFSDAVLPFGGGGVRYKFSDTLAASLGILVMDRLEDDVLVVPLLGLEWNITDRLTLSNENVAGARLSYQLTDGLLVYGSVEYDAIEFRLKERPGDLRDEAIAKHKRVPLSVGAEWQIIPALTFEVIAGASVWQELELQDRQGNTLAKDEAEVAPFFGIGLRMTF